MTKKRCKRIRWSEREQQRWGYVVEVTGSITDRGKKVPVVEGIVHHKRVLDEDDVYHDALQVSYVDVDPDYHRCGYGTAFYEWALDKACEQERLLVSDTSRTKFSEGFWRKQARKGRARCMQTQAWLRPDQAQEFSPTSLVEEEEKVVEWPCRRYAMNEVCPRSRDLGKVHKRKRRKKRRRG